MNINPKSKLKALLRHVTITLLTFIIVALFAGVAFNLSFMSPVARALENFSFNDIYYQMLAEDGEWPTSQAITIVDMTELQKRRLLAQLLDTIASYKPAIMGIDIVFEGERDDVEGDIMVQEAADRIKDKAVFSYTLNNYQNGQFQTEVHSFFTDEITVNEGFTNFQRSLYGDIKRTVSLGRPTKGDIKPSFIVQLANLYAGKKVFEAEDRDQSINFTPTEFKIVPYDSVAFYSNLISDRIVLVGAMNDLKDQHYTPLGKIAGVELLAYATQTLVLQKEIKEAPAILNIIVSFLLVLMTELLQSRYIKWSGRLTNRKYVRDIMSSEMALTIITFLWIILAVYLTFSAIVYIGYTVNLGWAISAVVFLNVCRKFIEICYTIIRKKA